MRELRPMLRAALQPFDIACSMNESKPSTVLYHVHDGVGIFGFSTLSLAECMDAIDISTFCPSSDDENLSGLNFVPRLRVFDKFFMDVRRLAVGMNVMQRLGLQLQGCKWIR